jgi:hypothetical protein
VKKVDVSNSFEERELFRNMQAEKEKFHAEEEFA